MYEEKLTIFVQGHECLYNLRHNDYDNNLVKDNCCKEIAGEWQGGGRFAAGEWHGMCESALRPHSYVIYHILNIQEVYIPPTACISVFCMDRTTNSDYSALPLLSNWF
jgi:hypothetical protein